MHLLLDLHCTIFHALVKNCVITQSKITKSAKQRQQQQRQQQQQQHCQESRAPTILVNNKRATSCLKWFLAFSFFGHLKRVAKFTTWVQCLLCAAFFPPHFWYKQIANKSFKLVQKSWAKQTNYRNVNLSFLSTISKDIKGIYWLNLFLIC